MDHETTAPDVRFKDLCLDAADPRELAAFWARALSRELVDTDDGGWRVVPDGPEATGIWVDPVPEPRVGKTRVHLDLRLATDDLAPLLDLGAVLVHDRAEDRHWWVLADPDGNEFCAMPPAPAQWGAPAVGHPTPFEVKVDCTDAEAQATWWAARTGGQAKTRGGDFWWVEEAAGFPWHAWVFGTVPEPKTVKNRMHWDVVLRDPSPTALIDAGATVLRERGDGRDAIDWWVLADREGNEFCAFLPSS